MRESPYTHCSHGKRYTEPCTKCEMIWHEEGLREAMKQAEKHQRKLDELRTARGQEGGQ